MALSRELGEAFLARRRELVALWAMGFLVLMSYGIVRPATDSLFLGAYGNEALPWAWLCVGVGALLVSGAVSSLAARHSLERLFGITLGATLLGLVALLGLAFLDVPLWPLLLYVFRDLYIVVLVEVFWSFANSVFPLKTARLLYGSFLVAGTLGELSGAQLVGFVSSLATVGTLGSLVLSVPVLLLAYIGGMALRGRLQAVPPPPGQRGTLAETFQVLGRSPYLLLLVALVFAVQVAVTLVDYEYNGVVRAAFPETDARTALISDVYSIIAVAALTLQILAGLILRFVGVIKTLALIPLVLGACLLSYVVAPSLGAILVAKVASKCFDYSLFRAGKEILYIPLGQAEKTQGKAIVDIFGYRVAKLATSFLLLGLGAAYASGVTSYVALLLAAVWLALVLLLGQRYRRLTAI